MAIPAVFFIGEKAEYTLYHKGQCWSLFIAYATP